MLVSEWVSEWVSQRYSVRSLCFLENFSHFPEAYEDLPIYFHFFVLIKTVTIGEILTGGESQRKTGLSYDIRIFKMFKRNSHREELKHPKSYIMELYYRSMVIYSSSILKIQQCFLWVILGISESLFSTCNLFSFDWHCKPESIFPTP